MSEPTAQGLNDVEWGYCEKCHFLVPVTEFGFLEPHTAGKYAARAACGVEDRKPITILSNYVVPGIARMDRIMADRIKNINDTPASED
jgi:hypothetical protein